MTTANPITTLTVDGAERTFTTSGAVEVYLHNGAPYARCADCGRGDYVRRRVRHSTRCGADKGAAFETTGATPPKPATPASPDAESLRAASDAAQHTAAVTTAFGGDEARVALAVRVGHLSVSDAMNRDD